MAWSSQELLYKQNLSLDRPRRADAKNNTYVTNILQPSLKDHDENPYVNSHYNYGFEKDSQTNIYLASTITNVTQSPPGNEDMSRNGCFKTKCLKYLIIILMGVLLTTATALSVVLVRERNEKLIKIEGNVKFDEIWLDAYSNHSSQEYKLRVKEFTEKMDSYYRKSSFADVYDRTEVLNLRKGSLWIIFTSFFKTVKEKVPLSTIVKAIQTIFPSSEVIIEGMSTTSSSSVSSTTLLPTMEDNSTTEETSPTTVTMAMTTESPITAAPTITGMSPISSSESTNAISSFFMTNVSGTMTTSKISTEQTNPSTYSTTPLQVTPSTTITTPSTTITTPSTTITTPSTTITTPSTTITTPSTTITTPSTTPTTPSTTPTTITTVTTPPSDMCFALDFSICADTGYTRTMYPNMFEDENLEEAKKTFYRNATGLINRGCSSLALHYVCGLIFPKCVNGNMYIPCLSTCLEIESKCGKEATIFPCIYFVDDEDYCFYPTPTPTTTSTKTSTTSVDKQTTPVSTKTTHSTKTTTSTDMCFALDFSICADTGYTRTMYPNMFEDENLEEAKKTFYRNATGLINRGCSSLALHYVCGLIFPKCVNGNMYIPCLSTCLAIQKDCGSNSTLFDCNYFVDDDSFCFLPDSIPTSNVPTTTIQKTTTPKMGPDSCYALEEPMCVETGYSRIMLPSLFNDMTQKAAKKRFEEIAVPIIKTECSPYITHYMCGMFFPKCVDSDQKFSCKSTCETIKKDCGSNATLLNCDFLTDDLDFCFKPPAKSCDPFLQTKCTNGECIKNFQVCDNVTHCSDGSDEANCTCPYGKFTCNDGTCIMSEWICDGESDCNDASDERDCNKCLSDQFVCDDYTCIDPNKQCNYEIDCPDGSDEHRCVLKSDEDLLSVVVKDRDYIICASTWNDTFGPLACEKIGMGDFISANVTLSRWSSRFAHIERHDSNVTHPTVFGPVTIRDYCKNSNGIQLTCAPKGCGIAPMLSSLSDFSAQVVPMIVRGSAAAPGSNPWYALLNIGSQVCGGSIIGEYFIVTAAHCVSGYKPEHIIVYLPPTDWTDKNAKRQKRLVQRIVMHNFTWAPKMNDIALLQLQTPIVFDKYIQPICLVGKNDIFTSKSSCMSSGYGHTSSSKDSTISDTLQEAKMTLWKTQKCNSSQVWNGEIKTGICAGYYSGQIAVCLGDSGGALWCKDEHEIAKLVGITSFVPRICDAKERPGVFTDVKLFLKWIEQKTKCHFKCRDNSCLFDRDLLCDRNRDCPDGSDETVLCTTTVSCNFNDKFLCGYKMANWTWSEPYILDDRLPKFDHTHGGPPGRYIFSKDEKGFLQTPVFTVTEPHCVRFYYQALKAQHANLDVYLLDVLNKTNRPVLLWSLPNDIVIDTWKMALITINITGTFRLEFLLKNSQHSTVSLDDIHISPGVCSENTCLKDEISCKQNDEAALCLPQEAQCNIVNHCSKTSEDEVNCTDSFYHCKFDNGVVCGIRQSQDDQYDWFIVPGKTAKTVDHTTRTAEGMVAYAPTYHKTTDPWSQRMIFDLKSENLPHCLQFYFQYDSTAVLQVSLSDGKETKILWSYSKHKATAWSKAQVFLPVSEQVNTQVYFDIIGAPPDSTPRPFIVLDDVSIKTGACLNLTCDKNWLACASGDLCYHSSGKCNRQINCMDFSDETSCVCHNDEFKCGSGRCIDNVKLCDGKQDCKDGSDEINPCAIYNNVTCAFENPYKCGYRTKGTEFTWLRGKGDTPSTETGPSRDRHGNKEGYFMYTEGSNGEKGDQAMLTSPTFNTQQTSSLHFYYHMFGNGMGSLSLSVTDQNTGVQTVIWNINGNQDDRWFSNCLPLPSNAVLKVTFTATRGKNYQNDMAIDDITLNHSPCSISGVLTTTPLLKTTTNSTYCPDGMWQCRSGECIPIQLKCNKVTDCLDATDEILCPS